MFLPCCLSAWLGEGDLMEPVPENLCPSGDTGLSFHCWHMDIFLASLDLDEVIAGPGTCCRTPGLLRPSRAPPDAAPQFSSSDLNLKSSKQPISPLSFAIKMGSNVKVCPGALSKPNTVHPLSFTKCPCLERFPALPGQREKAPASPTIR